MNLPEMKKLLDGATGMKKPPPLGVLIIGRAAEQRFIAAAPAMVRELMGMVEKMREYAQHFPRCPVVWCTGKASGDCSCGLEALLKEIG